MSARRAPALLLALVAAGCSADGARTPAADPGGDRPPLLLVDVRAAGLDVTQLAGDPEGDYIIDTVGNGGAWLDYDGDGDPDLYLAQGATRAAPRAGPPDRLLRNDGDADGDGVPSFTDVTATAGLGDRLWSHGVSVADYDNDGDPDLYLSNWGPNRLYRNDGNGAFSEIAGPAGVADARWSLSAAWSDVDLDGDLDLYVANYVEFDFDRAVSRGCRWHNIPVFCGPRPLEPAADALFRNDGDPDGDGVPSFTDVTVHAGLLGPAHYAMAVLFFDSDDDGDDDLYVANDSVINTYFVNRGDGTFEEASVLSGLAYNEQGHEQAGMGLAAADFDGDGRFDLVATNFSHDHDTLYRNEGDHTFLDVSYPAGLASPSYLTLGWGVVFADLDQDGWEDLFVAHGHVYPQVDRHDIGTTFRERNGVYRNLGDGRFEDVTDRAGSALEAAESSRSLLPVDLEGDGDLDLLVTNVNAAPQLIRNDGAGGHWLQVRLVGSASNRDGIGARVELSAGGRVQRRQISATASFAGSTLPVAHFGLGDSAVVERLEVRWPSGRRSVRESVAADHRLVIEEPQQAELAAP